MKNDKVKRITDKKQFGELPTQILVTEILNMRKVLLTGTKL